jgi:uncharacterized membrane protein YhhN
MNLKIFTTIYFTISLLEIIFGMNHFQNGVYFTKPLIMISIMIFYFLQTRNQQNFQDKFMIIAFFFSMLGDTFLMFKGEQNFMFGLGSFLITHLFYIFVFSRNGLKMNILARISFFVFSGIMLFILKNNVNNSLLIPVIFYMITITIMAITAAERNTNSESYYLVLIGAVLFVLSDSLIAMNEFVNPIPFSTLLIMGTYVFAQYLIAIGFLKKNTLT